MVLDGPFSTPTSACYFINCFDCLFLRPPSGADPGQVHMKYDAVKLQDYEFKITK